VRRKKKKKGERRTCIPVQAKKKRWKGGRLFDRAGNNARARLIWGGRGREERETSSRGKAHSLLGKKGKEAIISLWGHMEEVNGAERKKKKEGPSNFASGKKKRKKR